MREVANDRRWVSYQLFIHVPRITIQSGFLKTFLFVRTDLLWRHLALNIRDFLTKKFVFLDNYSHLATTYPGSREN